MNDIINNKDNITLFYIHQHNYTGHHFEGGKVILA